MILTKINKSCHESCHEIAEPLIFQGFWNLILWVQVPSPALTQKSRKHAIFIEKSKVYGFSKLDDINVMLMSQASSFADAGVTLTSYKDIPAAI